MMKKKTSKRRRSNSPKSALGHKTSAQKPKTPKKITSEAPITAKVEPEKNNDLLATYMAQLNNISLLSAEQEIEYAKQLLEFDLHTWQAILNTPKAVYHLQQEIKTIETAAELTVKIDKLLHHYQQIATRNPTRKLPISEVVQKQIQELTEAIHTFDSDKELLDKVVTRLRREVWSRRVLDASTPAFRLTHNDLTDIERAYGALMRGRNNFVRANLRLVVSVARNFNRFKIPFIDLIQEGNVGLMKAVHRFDHTRGFRFSTYAHWWIRQSIERAIINKGSHVRLPVHVIDSRRQVRRATAKLTQDLGRLPSTSEISEQLNVPTEKVDQVLTSTQQDPVSLDEKLGENDQRRFLDMLQDESAALDEALIRENIHARVREMLHMLSPIEKDIIRRRFGIGDDTDQTLDEIGKIYNLSRERVRQIQAQGLQKIRRMCERRQID